MVDILNALDDNLQEAKDLLTGEGEVFFAKWNEENGCYVSNDDEESYCEDCCPYIRMADDNGDIKSNLVVGVRYNEDIYQIEIMTTESEYTKSDGEWFPLMYADDISYWYVLERIGEMFE